MRPALQAVLLVVVTAVVTGVAALAGAPNLGTALTFGQIGFVVCLAVLVLRR